MVLVAVPHTGDLRHSLVEKLLEVDKNEEFEIFLNQARPVDVNRCEIVHHFMDETDHERLVMIDSDIIPPKELVEMLEKYDEPILSPIVFSTEQGMPYPAATMWGSDGEMHMYSGDIEELTEVAGVGTGCIAIKREVFEAMDEPYFSYRKEDDGTLNTGEDFEFCVDAAEHGYKPKVATEYVAGHVSEVDLANMMQLINLALDANPSDIFVEEVG